MKLVCFDVDGTLIDLEPNIWGVLNREYDFQNQDNILFSSYKKGNLTYQEWVNQDFEHYTKNGLNKNRLSALFKKYKLFSGVYETLKVLRQKHVISVLSGSIDFLLKVHEIDEFFEQMLINKLIFDGDKISEIEATQYDLEEKVEGLKYLLQLYHNDINDCAYIGDGNNDIPLSRFIKERGGTFVAFNSKSEELKNNARYVIDSGDMKDVLPYL